LAPEPELYPEGFDKEAEIFTSLIPNDSSCLAWCKPPYKVILSLLAVWGTSKLTSRISSFQPAPHKFLPFDAKTFLVIVLTALPSTLT